MMSWERVAVLIVVVGGLSCTSTDSVTVVSSERFEVFEGFVHIPPDSVAALYKKFSREQFYETYGPDLERTAALIDSLNRSIPPDRRIDTLLIEFAPEHFGNAGKLGQAIILSNGFFFVYEDPAVIRSIIYHEYGHIHYEMLPAGRQGAIADIWRALGRAALLYLFVDGEYSGNARFGGHPEDSPEELFASGFNLFHTRPGELRARLKFVPEQYYELIDSFKRDAGVTGLVLFE